MDIELIEATPGDEAVVRNLARFYVHDLSEFMGWACPEDGLFRPPNVRRYWTGPSGHPFLVRVNGELAGFALIHGSGGAADADWHVGEFFILRKFRRLGVGTTVACRLFERFRGRWEVMQLIENEPAQAFWRSVLAGYTSGHYEERIGLVERLGREMVIQRFDNSSGDAP